MKRLELLPIFNQVGLGIKSKEWALIGKDENPPKGSTNNETAAEQEEVKKQRVEDGAKK